MLANEWFMAIYQCIIMVDSHPLLLHEHLKVNCMIDKEYMRFLPGLNINLTNWNWILNAFSFFFPLDSAQVKKKIWNTWLDKC